MNNSSRRGQSYESLFKTVKVVQFAEATGMTCINLFVVFLYCTMKERRKKISNYLLFSQSITDLYNAFMIWFELIANSKFIKRSSYHQLFAMTSMGMLEYSFTLSLGTLFSGSFERYLSITRPYFHKTKVTTSKMKFCTVVTWIVSLIPPITLLSMMEFNLQNFNSQRVLVYSHVFDVIMLGVITAVVTILVLTLKRADSSSTEQLRFSKLHRCNARQKKRKHIALQKRLRLVLIFIFMIVAYIVTFLPLMIGRVLFDTGAIRFTMTNYEKIIMVSVCHSLYKSSALFNPFLTLLLKEDYRITMSSMFKSERWIGKHETALMLKSTTEHFDINHVSQCSPLKNKSNVNL